MDGLLLDTEDIYTACYNIILQKYGRPDLPWSLKAQLQGRPGPQASQLFHAWAQLPVSNEEFAAQQAALQKEQFPTTKPLPGVAQLLEELGRTRWWDLQQQQEQDQQPQQQPKRVHIALATSSNSTNFAIKTSHLSDLFSVFPSAHRVLGDDPRIQAGRGKPLPDIYLLALATINAALPPTEQPITPQECLVFEDSVPGVEAGRRAGMRVIWCPHPKLKELYIGQEDAILAGRMGAAGEGVDEHQLGQPGDGWGQYLETLEAFPYEKYGIVVPPKEVNQDEKMRESASGQTVSVQEGPKA